MITSRMLMTLACCGGLILAGQATADDETQKEPVSQKKCCQAKAVKGGQQCTGCCKVAATDGKTKCCNQCQCRADAHENEASKAEPGQQQAGRGPGFGRGHGRGRGGLGFGRGQGFRGGRGPDAQFAEDHEVFFFLLSNRDKIRRTVKNLPNGVETVTESNDANVAAKIQEHVEAMYQRVDEGRGIHMRDPLFAEVFRNADKIKMVSEPTEKGARVVETSEDPYVAKLIQAHAKVVDAFVKKGHSELHRNHDLPKR